MFFPVLPSVHNGAAAKYSELTGLPVFLPTYRLAPEHPFPAAADDALAAYTSLIPEAKAARKYAGQFLAAPRHRNGAKHPRLWGGSLS